jgi:CheY-like chemotaxis protein
MINRNGRTVLVVEDDPAVRKLVAGFLESRGYVVLAAGSGAEALTAAEAYRGEIDLIITDFGLGAMNGLELAARIAGTRPGIAILLISGYTELPLPPGLKDAVRAQFLAKPFTMEGFLAKVDGMLRAPGEGRAPL